MWETGLRARTRPSGHLIQRTDCLIPDRSRAPNLWMRLSPPERNSNARNNWETMDGNGRRVISQEQQGEEGRERGEGPSRLPPWAPHTLSVPDEETKIPLDAGTP